MDQAKYTVALEGLMASFCDLVCEPLLLAGHSNLCVSGHSVLFQNTGLWKYLMVTEEVSEHVRASRRSSTGRGMMF